MKRNNRFEVKFEYPAEPSGYYDDTNRMAYIFGKEMRSDVLVDYLSHETLHWVLHKELGKRVARKLDRIAKKIRNWDETAYTLLY